MIAFCGIDVACAKGKALPVAVVIRESNRILALPLRTQGPRPPRGMGNARALDDDTRLAFAQETLAYIEAVERSFDVEIQEIAIDAPRLPAQGTRRLCEQAMDRAGISCIPTPNAGSIGNLKRVGLAHLGAGGAAAHLPYANQIWMLVGFDLFATLGTRYRCIEVFPNAIVQTIARGAPHKSNAAGFEQQLTAFEAWSGFDRSQLATASHGARHDRLDAVMSAWIASLDANDRVAHGDGGADTIWSVSAAVHDVRRQPAVA